jgi:glycogen debranching enzyme
MSADGFCAPTLAFDDPDSQMLYGAAYDMAIGNLMSNTVVFDPTVYNGSGLMDLGLGTFIQAGGGYDQPWTRDASINSWNAASVLCPRLARNTLWAVVDRDASGRLRVQQDEQTWDQVVWVVAAWNHYLVTGDREFLRSAYEAARNTLRIRESAVSHTLDPVHGLFTGPAFFNDGVAGYSAAEIGGPESNGSASFDYDGVNSSMHLSTNALYHAAYASAADMARTLGEPRAVVDGYLARAEAVGTAIATYLWNPRTGLYRYAILADGTPDEHQEGSGLAFAILFGLADRERTRSILANAAETNWGMPDVFPAFARYSEARPGRHNAMIWPLVQGLWARAAAKAGATGVFAAETRDLAQLANASGGFREIYNASTGEVDGGWQTGRHWDSATAQTWSATAYLDMIHSGLFGMSYDQTGLHFAPMLPEGWGDVALTGLRYRGATLTVVIRGSGSHVRSVAVDAMAHDRAAIPTTLVGEHFVEIVLSEQGGRAGGPAGAGQAG